MKMRRNVSSRVFVGVLVLVGLGACSEANYVLQLDPVVPLNQAELLQEGQLFRFQRDGEPGAPGWVDAGALRGGQAKGRGVGVLEGGWVGLAVQAEGARAGDDDLSSLVAFGEIGPFDLAREPEEVVRTVLVASTDGVGSLGSLPEAAALSAAALTSAGEVYVFGGSTELGRDPGSDAVYKLSALDSGAWSFTQVATLPAGVVGARAELVVVDGEELIALTGGQASYDDDFGPYFGQVLLFDPGVEEVVWSGELQWAHADHVTLRLGDQRVLLASMNMDAADAPDVEARVELFSAKGRESSRVSGASFGGWHAAGTVLSDGRALLCGGSLLDASDNTQDEPVTACDFVDERGELEPGPALEQAVSMHAMATLLDGRVLLTGGVEGSVPFGGTVEASKRAWLWDPAQPNRWTAVGELGSARALHRMVVRQDGKVWVLGGAEEGGLEVPSFSGAPRCAELFDPATERFEPAGVCHAAGTGAQLTVASHPRQGVVVIEGVGTESGGQKVGYLPIGPAL